VRGYHASRILLDVYHLLAVWLYFDCRARDRRRVDIKARSLVDEAANHARGAPYTFLRPSRRSDLWSCAAAFARICAGAFTLCAAQQHLFRHYARAYLARPYGLAAACRVPRVPGAG